MTTATTTTQSLSESEPVAAAPTMDDVEPDKASNDDRFPLLHAGGSHERLLPDVVHDGESSGAAAIGIDAADPPEAYAYPRAVAYIVGNEFCERFSFYGMRTILFIYLNNFLAFEETAARAILHVFIMFAYFFPLLGRRQAMRAAWCAICLRSRNTVVSRSADVHSGGVLSDSYLGKFWTIFYLSLVYCVGNIVLAVTAIPGVTGTPPHWWGAALGLGLLALGTGR